MSVLEVSFMCQKATTFALWPSCTMRVGREVARADPETFAAVTSTSTTETTRGARRASRGFRALSGPPSPLTLADLDACFVELSLVPVGAGAGADGDVGGVGDGADGCRFGEGLSVDDDLDHGRGFDAGDGVPVAVVDRGSGDEFGVAACAFEAAGGLAGLLELHLPLGAAAGVEAFAEDVPVGWWRWRGARRFEVDGEGDVGNAGVEVCAGGHADVAGGAVEAVGGAGEAGQAGLGGVEGAGVAADRVEH